MAKRFRFRLVFQPPLSKLCGHACVAMVTGTTLDKVQSVIGHSHGTTTRELVRAIRKLGGKCSSRLQRIGTHVALPDRAIVKISLPKTRNWHWVVYWDNHLFDPAQHWRFRAVGRVTSFLPILKRETRKSKQLLDDNKT